MEGKEESLIEIISLPFDLREREDEDRHFPILLFPFLQVQLSHAGDAKKTDASGTLFDKLFLLNLYKNNCASLASIGKYLESITK